MAFSTVKGALRATETAATTAAICLLTACGTDAANVGASTTNTVAPAVQRAALALVSSGGYPVSVGWGRALPVATIPAAAPPRAIVSAAGNAP